MTITWRLRMVAAERDVWTAAELSRLMKRKTGRTLSPASLSVLMNKAPKETKLETLSMLCIALECTPGDLLVLVDEARPTIADDAVRAAFDRIGSRDSQEPRLS